VIGVGSTEPDEKEGEDGKIRDGWVGGGVEGHSGTLIFFGKFFAALWHQVKALL